MKKVNKILVVLLIITLFIVGCSSDDAKNKDKELVVMISPLPKGDPFIELTYDGLEQLESENENVQAKFVEALDKSEYSEQIRAMSEEGAKTIYVMWDDLAEEVFKIAPDFPETNYIVVDTYATSELDNVKTITVEPQDSAFIAGVVASNLSETGKVAFLGSMDMPVINRYMAGFNAGVEYAGNNTEVESLYIGTADDPNKAAELTKQVINNGADIVMHAANKAGLGVIQACEELGVKAIGADEFQGDISEAVIWSALKDITGAAYEAGKSSIEGNFEPGFQEYNIDSGVSLYDERDFEKLPDDLKTKIKDVEELLKTGEIEVPTEMK